MTDLKKHNTISAATVSRLVKIAEYNRLKRERKVKSRYSLYFQNKNLCRTLCGWGGLSNCEALVREGHFDQAACPRRKRGLIG